MRKRAARPDLSLGNPYKGFQNFPNLTTPQPPRPDREGARIDATASATFTRSAARGPASVGPFEPLPYAGGWSPNRPPMQGGCPLLADWGVGGELRAW